MGDATKPFATVSNRAQIREILSSVYDSLMLKGYNPINQLVGYILSEDPTYITNYNNARSLICRIDRDELLQELVRSYLEDKEESHRNKQSRRRFLRRLCLICVQNQPPDRAAGFVSGKKRYLLLDAKAQYQCRKREAIFFINSLLRPPLGNHLLSLAYSLTNRPSVYRSLSAGGRDADGALSLCQTPLQRISSFHRSNARRAFPRPISSSKGREAKISRSNGLE